MKANKKIFIFLALIILVCCSSCGGFNNDDYIYPGIDNTFDTDSANQSENLSNAVIDTPSDKITNNLITDTNIGTDDKETDLPVQNESTPPTHLPPDENEPGGLVPDVQKSVLVTFNSDGGEVVPDISIAINSNYTLPVPNKLGYKFDGWYDNNAQVAMNGVWSYKNDVTLKAKWSKINYTINYDLNGGRIKDSSSLPKTYQISNYSIYLGVPSKSGNVKFIGWLDKETNEILYDIPKKTAKNFNLVAQWYEFEYTYKTDKGLLLYLKDDKTLSVVGYEGPTKNIVIPREYNGYVINEIGKHAFACLGVQLIQMNISGFIRCDMYETVTKISEGAFGKCEDLKVQLHQDSYLSVEEWLSILEIEKRNDHVRDVIEGLRPAIGWKPYVK